MLYTIRVFYDHFYITQTKVVSEEEFNADFPSDHFFLGKYCRLEYRVNGVVHRENKPAIITYFSWGSMVHKSYYQNGTIIKTIITPEYIYPGTSISEYTIYYDEHHKKENDVITTFQSSPVENIGVKSKYTLVHKENKIVEENFEPLEDWKEIAKKRFDEIIKERNTAHDNAVKAKDKFQEAERRYQKIKEDLLAHKILELNDLPNENKCIP